MANIFIIHGTGGSPERNWFPWLKLELEKLGHMVFVPKFPTPENQTLKNWLEVFRESYEKIDESTIMIGHSLGPAFILRVLENLNKQIRASFLVAGFVGLLNNSGFDELNKTFIEGEFDWNKIKENCRKFYVINSDNDPYVPLKKGEDLAKNLGTDLILIKIAGHINEESGYTKFDFLLEKIMEELNG